MLGLLRDREPLLRRSYPTEPTYQGYPEGVVLCFICVVPFRKARRASGVQGFEQGADSLAGRADSLEREHSI